jgi:Cu(I)/Ag(I) efflux system membrane fusion protein
MKSRLIVFGLCTLLLAAFAYVKFAAPVGERGQTSGSAAAEYYTCPMHPTVRSDRPGACPVCGMALVKKSSLVQGSTADTAAFSGVALSPTQRVMANISTVAAERRTLTREIRAVGAVTFAEPLQATVAARFRGRIEKLHVNFTGQLVRRGEPLFDLYSPDLISAEREFLLGLEAAGTTAPGDNLQAQMLQSTKDRLKVHFGLADGQIAAIERDRQLPHSVSFHSPLSGTVLEKRVQEGDFVDEGMVLYRLADLSTVWVILEIYEQDIRFIQRGMPVVLSTDAYPGEVFRGHVTFVDPVLDPESRSVRVRVESANPLGKLKPNMYVRGTVKVTVPDAIVVPTTAVLVTGRRSVVWVEIRTNAFEPRTVTTGTSGDSFTQILSGLRGGESVAVTGGFLIDSESALTMQPAAREKASEVSP